MPGSMSLAPDEVHIWLLNSEQFEPAAIRRLRTLLSLPERQRAAQFGHAGARFEYRMARSLSREMLAKYAGVAPTKLHFTTDAFGKPLLDSPVTDPRLHFNISHSHGLIACAVASGRQVGIDIEDRSRVVEYLALAERYFAPAEVAHLRTLSGADLQAAFFAIWTLKEAFVKAIGMGLRFPLDTFWFELDRDRLVRFHPPPNVAGSWQCVQFDAGERHCGALAVEDDRSEVRVVVRDWSESSVDMNGE